MCTVCRRGGTLYAAVVIAIVSEVLNLYPLQIRRQIFILCRPFQIETSKQTIQLTGRYGSAAQKVITNNYHR